MDSTAKLREPKPPRGLILSTGEDVSRGQSVRARLLILELSKDSVDAGALTQCQEDANAGFYAEAMGGYVQWFAGRYEEMRALFGEKVAEYRARAQRNPAHARTPDIVANLQAGFELYLEFGVETGAMDSTERNELASRCWNALSCAATAQSKHHAATEAATRYLELIRSSLASGRAHLEARGGGAPDQSPASCGWRGDNAGGWVARGECIGWVDEDDLYLEPAAAYRVVQIAGRDMGEILAVSEQTLKKRLHEKRLLASVDGARQTLTVRRNICGSSKSVLHFLRSTILPEVSDGDEDAE